MNAKIKRRDFLSAKLLSGWMAFYFSACQKSGEEVQTAPLTNEDPAQLVEQFNQAMQAWKQGVPYKSGEKISIDSAIWYIDATLNYYYANSNATSAMVHRDTVYVEMELVNDYEAMYQQVFASYDESLSGLSEKYHAISGENKRFIMATVNDAGPLPENKHKLQIVTISGTGILQSSGDFGEDELYLWNRNAQFDCNGDSAFGAPVIFETMLDAHFNAPPAGSCYWFFYGPITYLPLYYLDYPLNSTLQNYLDYKIYAASSAVGDGLTDEVKCLEDDQNSSGVHEMQFYYDHLKVFVSDWLASPENTENKKLARSSEIESPTDFINNATIIFHRPVFEFRKRGKRCSIAIEIPPID